MPKKEKVWIDLTDLEILSCLCYVEEGTAYRISDKIGLSKATISDRLKWLVWYNVLQPPVDDVSTGRLRKIYTPPDKRFVFELIKEYYCTANKVDPKKFKFFIIEKVISATHGRELRKLIQGVNMDYALTNIFIKYSNLLAWDVLGFVKVTGENDSKSVKLTKKGIKNVKICYPLIVAKYLSELREFSRRAHEDFVARLCSKNWEDLEREFSEMFLKWIEGEE